MVDILQHCCSRIIFRIRHKFRQTAEIPSVIRELEICPVEFCSFQYRSRNPQVDVIITPWNDIGSCSFSRCHIQQRSGSLPVEDRVFTDVHGTCTCITDLCDIINPQRCIFSAGPHVGSNQQLLHILVRGLHCTGIQFTDDTTGIICSCRYTAFIIDFFQLAHDGIILWFQMTDDAAGFILSGCNSGTAGAIGQIQPVGIANETSGSTFGRRNSYIFSHIDFLRYRSVECSEKCPCEAAYIAGTGDGAVTNDPTIKIHIL